jgi:hypothetical protein
MRAYHWAMRHASMILFYVSAVLFLIGLGNAVLVLKSTSDYFGTAGQAGGSGIASLLSFFANTFAALSSAAIPFLGAVAVNRWDRKNP